MSTTFGGIILQRSEYNASQSSIGIIKMIAQIQSGLARIQVAVRFELIHYVETIPDQRNESNVNYMWLESYKQHQVQQICADQYTLITSHINPCVLHIAILFIHDVVNAE